MRRIVIGLVAFLFRVDCSSPTTHSSAAQAGVWYYAVSNGTGGQCTYIAGVLGLYREAAVLKEAAIARDGEAPGRPRSSSPRRLFGKSSEARRAGDRCEA